MNTLPHRADIDAYDTQAKELLAAAQSNDRDAAWRFKWEHPRFRGKPVTEVKTEDLDQDDARLVIARSYAFETWTDLEAFTRSIHTDLDIARFESAVEAVVAGDTNALTQTLRDHPGIVHARSTRRHHATLLHYIAANGVEGSRQRTPPNAVAIATLLLEAGADPNALADMYDAQCTTMSMLVSSAPPAQAGLQTALAELLVDYGAKVDGAGSRWQSAILTALAFGYQDTARSLARRDPPPDNLAIMAGLGRLNDVIRLLPHADSKTKHVALALAAQHGHTDVVRVLLDANEDPNRYNPEGFHAHSTPLHQAVWSNHRDVVRLLVERGAALDFRDSVYEGTPLDWAIYGNRTEIADYLRQLNP